MQKPKQENDRKDLKPSLKRNSARGRRGGRAFNKGRQGDPNTLQQVKQILGNRPRRRDLLIEHLHLFQDKFGFITTKQLVALSYEMKMAMAEVYEVASFYSMFNLEPIGKNFIQVCTTTSCWLRGSDDILKLCKKHLSIENNQTTKDGLFTLKEVECLGACVNAPMIQINDNYYEELNKDSLLNILNKLKEGKEVNIGPQTKKRKGAEPINSVNN